MTIMSSQTLSERFSLLNVNKRKTSLARFCAYRVLTKKVEKEEISIGFRPFYSVSVAKVDFIVKIQGFF